MYRSCSRAIQLLLSIGGGAGKREVTIGISVCAMISEATMATQIGIAACVSQIEIWLLEPNRIGRNTTTQVAVPASVATPTSLTPASVAACGWSGSICRWRNTLSVTTTALSTSMPMASIMPIIDITLMVRPTKYITASVTSSDSGTDALTMSVVGQCRRNRNNTAKASAAPMSPASVRSLSEDADRLGLVVDGEYADALHLRQRLVVFDDLEHAFDDLDDVGLRGLEHVEADRRAGHRDGGGA